MAQILPRRVALAFRNASDDEAALDILLKSMRPDWHTIRTNFFGDALDSNWAAGVVDGGPSGSITIANKMTLTTGTTDNGHYGQGPGLAWKGDNGVYFETIAAPGSAITTVKYEIGLTDSASDAGAVATKATPTGTADDFCVLVFDTDDNTQLDIISELDNGGPAANAENVYTLAASTIFSAEFKAQGDVVGVFINGSNVGSGSMQGGDLVTPWWFAQARAGSASRTLDVYWAFCTGPNGNALVY